MNQLPEIFNNTPLLLLVLVWSLVWKGLALWRAAKRGNKVWYIIILILNSLGLMEIIYLLATNSKVKKTGLMNNF
ncbi:hypothetical protein GYA13_01960 [Candidatus Kuenenbacteria bacterium]|nr:hypothetical protein [Candidatus Kuenenbacteria bacterium]